VLARLTSIEAQTGVRARDGLDIDVVDVVASHSHKCALVAHKNKIATGARVLRESSSGVRTDDACHAR
jgi:hypothetical protein